MAMGYYYTVKVNKKKRISDSANGFTLLVSTSTDKYLEQSRRLNDTVIGRVDDAMVLIRKLDDIYNVKPRLEVREISACGKACYSTKTIILRRGATAMTVVHEYTHLLGFTGHDDAFYQKCEELAEQVVGLL